MSALSQKRRCSTGAVVRADEDQAVVAVLGEVLDVRPEVLRDQLGEDDRSLPGGRLGFGEDQALTCDLDQLAFDLHRPGVKGGAPRRLAARRPPAVRACGLGAGPERRRDPGPAPHACRAVLTERIDRVRAAAQMQPLRSPRHGWPPCMVGGRSTIQRSFLTLAHRAT
ncbi:hypothetical protein [Microtetraspora malaysiensis]|uniref:hypothetical protein n=1 Tax=Microtetraspora malaysiensis TaxID=161358 RepID=UPI003D8C91BE